MSPRDVDSTLGQILDRLTKIETQTEERLKLEEERWKRTERHFAKINDVEKKVWVLWGGSTLIISMVIALATWWLRSMIP